jgi:hypothetical protein
VSMEVSESEARPTLKEGLHCHTCTSVAMALRYLSDRWGCGERGL